MKRNYPDPHSGPHPDGYEYQTETQWFMQFAQDIPFVMGANYHGGSEVMNYPWDNSYTLHADDAWWKLVCHEYADLCHAHSTDYMVLDDPDSEDGIINGALWYMIGGGRQDYMNGYAQCREVTIECSNSKLPNANQLPAPQDSRLTPPSPSKATTTNTRLWRATCLRATTTVPSKAAPTK